MKTWTSAEVFPEIARSSGVNAATTQRIAEAVLGFVRDKLAEGKRVTIADLGTLYCGKPAGSAVVVPGPDTQDAIEGAHGLNSGDVQKVSAALVDAVIAKVMRHDVVDLADFFSLRLKERKASIVPAEDGHEGVKTIAVTKRSVELTASPALIDAVARGAIEFEAAGKLKEQLETARANKILLASKDAEDPFIKTIEYHFSKAGWIVEVVTALQQAKQYLIEDPISLIIVDCVMPEADGVVEYAKTHKKSSLVPILEMLPAGKEKAWFKTFRFMGNEQLSQPFEVKEMLELGERELERSTEEQAVFEQEVYFRFPTEDQWIDRANEIGARLFSDSGLNEGQQVQMCTAFREACSNAAQHGNRHRRDRFVDVEYYLDAKRLTVVVSDQGKGFDWRLYVAPAEGAVDRVRDRRSQGKLGGLGIMLMTKCVDKVEYNDEGNRVTLTKFKEERTKAGVAQPQSAFQRR
ncbi:MAG: ATP-binding protein [Planctomycetes bacterium]|nr:ATP-binding protein [Planctomycetota bacterium]MCW8136534.1 ATP-binding protein [Planctomycetota bacterium]